MTGGRPSRVVAVLRAAGAVVSLTAVMTAFWVGAHYGLAWLMPRLGLHPPAVVMQVVASFAGLILFGTLAGTLGGRHRAREVDAWHQLVDALRRIARGDFGVRLEPMRRGGRHPFDQLVAGVNDMALELDRLETMRQEFISNVSHEIQSPLTSIGGFARALREDAPGPEERTRYLMIIETEVERLSRLSENLLRLAALDSDTSRLRQTSYRLDAQLQRVILAAEPQWGGKGLDLEADLAPVDVVADEALLDQVWTNLLYNAIKFTPAGGGIAVRARPCGERVEVQIADSGIGMVAADRERAFERFFKADRSRSRQIGGSGLGLALAHQIVTLHAGSIGVESEPDRGTTVSVSLPATGAIGARAAT